MRLIFLDIDGVLNRTGTLAQGRTTIKWGSYIGMEPELVARFNELCARTDAKVVLSSTWRMDPDWRITMLKNGLTCEFLDATPEMRGYMRGDEIAHWLDANTDPKIKDKYFIVHKYAIIDDNADFFWHQPLFQTNHEEGLTQEIADAIAAHLTVDNSVDL